MENVPTDEGKAQRANGGEPETHRTVAGKPTGVEGATGAQPWGLVAKMALAAVSAGGVMLHMMGLFSHAEFLSHWGIDAGLFPMPTDATIMNGYYVFLFKSASILNALSQKAPYLFAASLAMAGYVFFLWLVLRSKKTGKLVDQIRNVPQWVRALFRSVALVLAGMVAVPVGLALIVAVLVVPAYLAVSFGKEAADAQKTAFMAGCSQRIRSERCVELHMDKKLLARGFEIQASESRMAIYDVVQRRVRIFELKGIEVVGEATQ